MPHSIAIAGLLTVKPGNEPQEGDVKTFVIEQRTSKGGKPWTKIKSAGADFGGTPYRIISAEKTDFVDSHGNVSYNLQIEAVNGPQTSGNAPRTAPNSGGDDRSNRIERQHSQSAAIAYFAIEGKVPTTKELQEMTSWLQRDISRSPEIEEEPEF